MATIKIKVKGVSSMTLSKEYNSLSVYTANKDDVGFNDSPNSFSDYLLNSACGDWNTDKIKILSLPTQGYLFYNTNPTGTPSYAPVTVGQEILTKQMIDYKILKFSGEGSADNQFTGTYLTNFTFERFCGVNSQNEVVTVNLNMVDLQQALNVTYTEVSRTENLGLANGDCSDSEVVFDLAGAVSGFPLQLNLSGSSAGARFRIDVVSGSGSINDTSNNPFEFYNQSANGDASMLNTVDLLLTQSGTSRYKITLTTSDVIRHPTTNQLVQLDCYFESGNLVEQYANASLSTGMETIVSVSNQRKMMYL